MIVKIYRPFLSNQLIPINKYTDEFKAYKIKCTTSKFIDGFGKPIEKTIVEINSKNDDFYNLIKIKEHIEDMLCYEAISNGNIPAHYYCYIHS